MTQKIFGLDLGTNSIGSSVRNPDLGSNLTEQLEFFSSDVFDNGVSKGESGREYSLAGVRSAHRRSRRLNEVRRRKLWATLALLIEKDLCPMSPESLEAWKTYDKKRGLYRRYPIGDEAFNSWILLDFNGDGKPDYSSPYQLRRELVTQQFDFTQKTERYKLGRALYHIAQHRGFKSSKGETIAAQEENDKIQITAESLDIASEMKASEEKISGGLQTYIEENGLRTVGEAFAKLEDEGIRIRNNSDYCAVRSQFKEEIKQIFKFQKGLSLESELYERLVSEKKGIGTIFYKRSLRSQRCNVGKCTLERNKPRCPVGHPEFEKFRAWSFINNIKIRSSVEDIFVYLPITLRKELYYERFLSYVKTDFKFEEIRKYLEKRLGLHFSYEDKTINYSDDTSVAGCPITVRLKKVLGDDWENFYKKGNKKKQGQGRINHEEHQVSYTWSDIWHICYNADELDSIEAFARNVLQFDENKIKDLKRLWAAIPQGYAMLSLKAIRNINRLLLLGLKYSDAVLLAKLPEIVPMSDDEILFISTEFLKLEKQLNEEKRIKAIINSLIAKYKSELEENRFADHNYEYQLDDEDEKIIVKQIEESIGKKCWALMGVEEQMEILQGVRAGYQKFFRSHERKFVELPKLGERLVNFLVNRYPNVGFEKWKQLYHPSQIAIYRPVQAKGDHSLLRLGNPNIGAIKNPVVMKVLNILRKRVNQLLDDGLISPDETRVVVETARELNDANTKWAIDNYDRNRSDERKRIEKILQEFYPNRKTISEQDIDNALYVLEQREGDCYTKDKGFYYKKDITRYKLWLEQGGLCMYTGKTINLSNLFNPNTFDIEHTIPESISFDSSDQNLTLCDAYYNRFIKQNRIPTDMPNYNKDMIIEGKEYSAIKPRLQMWEERIKRLRRKVEYWKAQACRAQDKDRKDKCIQQKHLWEMELSYWSAKLKRFTVTEVTDGFKNSQLVDTRIITRHATLYLKSIFSHVEVQRGSTTAKFRKILGIQASNEKKDRSLHSHHAIDATMLTVIPVSAKRDRMLELFYKIEEAEKAFRYYGNEGRNGLKQYLEGLHLKLTKEIKGCYIGRNVCNLEDFINDNIIVNHHYKNQAMTPAHRKLRKRGKIVGSMAHPQWQTGDSLRGKIHEDSYYGAITQFAKDIEGNVLVKDGQVQIDPIVIYVIRRTLKYKQSAQDSGFASWEDLENVIIDKNLFALMKAQFPEGTSFKEACEEGIYMIKKGKSGSEDVKMHRIKHVRCKAPKAGLKLKEQTYKSSKEYKQYFYAGVGDLYAMCSYTNGTIHIFKVYSLYDISCNRKAGIEDVPQFIIDNKGNRLSLEYKLQKGDMVLLYKDSPEELRDLDQINLKQRLYKVNRFESKGNLILLTNHLSATKERGSSLGKITSYQSLPAAIRCGISTIKFLIMGDHHDFVIRKGNIEFNR